MSHVDIDVQPTVVRFSTICYIVSNYLHFRQCPITSKQYPATSEQCPTTVMQCPAKSKVVLKLLLVTIGKTSKT